MSPDQLLQIVNVATPCRADWNRMTGDDRSRFCEQCHKHVYNLSAMSADQAVALIRKQEGDLCIRLYRRSDGTVLSGDCPVGVRRVWGRTQALAATIVAAGLFTLSSQVWPAVSTRVPAGAGPAVAVSRTPPLRQRWREFVDDVKTWLGLSPSASASTGRFVMGGCEENPRWAEGMSEINRLYEIENESFPPVPPSAAAVTEF